MQIYLAGENGKKRILCNYFLPGQCSKIRVPPSSNWGGTLQNNSILKYKPYILESFYYADEITEKLIPYFGDFLLDSGAFTFMQGKSGAIDWDEYIEKYSAFINRTGTKKFFELDIDSIVGYDKVLQYRRMLEAKTGKQCIPVWHKSRGKEEYIRMCKEYPYVALGGIAIAKGAKDEFDSRYFPWFIKTAHDNGAKIHCLGYTNMEGIKKYHFDSVDSTSWTAGNRFGFLYHFDGKTMQKVERKGHRINKPQEAALNNFIEWIRFQQYADKYY